MSQLAHGLFRFGLWLAILLVAGCASFTGPEEQFDLNSPRWNGRLSVQQNGTESKAFSATFELAGDASLGQLALYSPLGSTVAHIRWSPQGAVLSGQGAARTFSTLGALTRELTGTELPIGGVFAWLAGGEALVNGWNVDAADLDAGKLFAHRTDATTRTTLKILLDR